MAKVPTVYDVAERAGVSIATVSFAFRRPEKVKDSTRELVLAAARQLGYVPSASARGLAHGRTKALGLLAFDYLLDVDETPLAEGGPVETDHNLDDPNAGFRLFPLYVDEIQRGVELECWRQEYALMIGGRGQATTESVLADVAGRVDGIAVFPSTVPADALHRIAWRIPVVELSEPAHDDQLNHVTVDNAAGMRAITDHLIMVHGLQRLTFAGDTTGSDQQARFQGFRAALRAASLPIARKPLAHPGGIIKNAAAVVGDLLTRRLPPQALVCATDQEALALLDALQAAGVAVPGDISVTGFDGIAAGMIVRPQLTTVRQPMEQMGRAVVDILIDRIANPQGPPRNTQLPVRLVLRESCGCRSS